MNFVNDYKLIYVKEVEGVRKLYASKSTVTTDDDVVLVPNLDSLDGVKLVYEKDGKFYTSAKTITTDEDEGVEVKCGDELVLSAGVVEEVKSDDDDDDDDDGDDVETNNGGDEPETPSGDEN